MEKEINLLNKTYKSIFKQDGEAYISTGGRLEIIGNHTDHNHGLCIVGNCSLRMKAIVSKTDNVVIKSKGYDVFSFSISDLGLKEEEKGTSLAITKGVIKKLHELGYKIGGFSVYIDSEIPSGSGVSSSAAYEVLIGSIISYLYNGSKIDSLTLAKVGQYAERVYFDKPCGLLDQIGVAFSSCNYLDFKDINNPIIETIPFDLPLSIYLIKSEGDHSSLTDLYAGIPLGMKKVANDFGVDYLREIKYEDFMAKYNSLKERDESYLKAFHFFNENKNVIQGVTALKNKDIDSFLDAIRKSQDSSKTFIKNTYVNGEYKGSPQEIIDVVSDYLSTSGAVRIHGGGFKGSVICFVKKEHEETFEKKILDIYGKEKVTKVFIPKKAIEYISLLNK